MGSRLQEGTPNGASSVPTQVLRGGLYGLFVDFDHLPALLADMGRSKERRATVAQWADLLEKLGFDYRHIDPDDYPVIQPEAALAADGAWRFAECMGVHHSRQIDRD